MAKRTKPIVRPEKKRTKPAKPKSESDDVRSVSLEEFVGALLKVPQQHNDKKIRRDKPTPIVRKPLTPKQDIIPLSVPRKDG
jgi:hypothetical protein